jgi:hypothetical protein
VPDVIEQNKDSVVIEWIKRVKANVELTRVTLSEVERKDHVPELLDEAVALARGRSTREKGKAAAARHGKLRYSQGYSVPMLIAEARLLQDVLAECVRRNLVVIDMTHLVSDLMNMWDTITTELEESARAFMNELEGRSLQSVPRNAK